VKAASQERDSLSGIGGFRPVRELHREEHISWEKCRVERYQSSPCRAPQSAVTREVFVSHGIQNVFDFIAAEDVLPKILTGYGMVPGVAWTSNVSDPWDLPGSHRVVHMADRSTANEGVTHYDRPSYFACRVSNPTFALKYLMTEASGQFWFEPADGGTQVKWTYTFHAKKISSPDFHLLCS
jgi:hypothetical protein